MEEASKSPASFRASRPEDTLAAELSHHPQHCLSLLQRAQKSILAETGEQTLPCTQASPPCSCMFLPVSTEAAGGRAGMGGCSPRAPNHLGTSTCKTPIVKIHQQFIVLKFSAMSSQLAETEEPQAQWPLSVSSSGGGAEPQGRFPAPASTTARPSPGFAVG